MDKFRHESCFLSYKKSLQGMKQLKNFKKRTFSFHLLLFVEYRNFRLNDCGCIKKVPNDVYLLLGYFITMICDCIAPPPHILCYLWSLLLCIDSKGVCRMLFFLISSSTNEKLLCPQILAMWFCGVSRRINKLSRERQKWRENMKRERTDGQ